MSEDYAKKAHTLFDKYYPIEIDTEIPFIEKKKLMNEWWNLHFKLLIESGLNRSDLKDIVENGIVKFRDGVQWFIDYLHENSIPLVILSANGVGDSIEMYLEKIECNHPNICRITNRFIWDEEGNAVSHYGPLINSHNKDETIINEIPEVYEKIKDQRNVILIGDCVGDIGMVEGFKHENLLKLGFLNHDPEKLIKNFEENYDVVILGDGDFSFVNNLIRELK